MERIEVRFSIPLVVFVARSREAILSSLKGYIDGPTKDVAFLLTPETKQVVDLLDDESPQVGLGKFPIACY